MARQIKLTAPRLKETRLHQGLTQLDLAIKAGVGEQTIIRIERGAPAKELTLHRIANGLGVPVERLLAQEELAA